MSGLVQRLEARRLGRHALDRDSVLPLFTPRWGARKEQLQGHQGCVNRLAWNTSGELLASVSDDRRLLLWRVGTAPRVQRVEEVELEHSFNVFGVAFVGAVDDGSRVVTGAMDGEVRLYERGHGVRLLGAYETRVKEIERVHGQPECVLAVLEHGRIMQYDLRTREQEQAQVLFKRDQTEFKSASVCRVNADLVAVGSGSSPAVYLMDRRRPGSEVAGELKADVSGMVYSTYVTFGGAGGEEVLVTYSNEHAYLLREGEAVVGEEEEEEVELEGEALMWKNRGNAYYRAGEYATAVGLYGRAEEAHGRAHSVVCNNRAMALLHREWKGDAMHALMDANASLRMKRAGGPNYKAHFRKAKALHALGQYHSAMEAIEAAPKKARKATQMKELAGAVTAALEEQGGCDEGKCWTCSGAGKVDVGPSRHVRYAGHVNMDTDIKEAEFLGRDQVVVGSDDGFVYVYGRKSGQLQAAWPTSHEIVNCVRPHPERALIATSGLDSEVSVWGVEGGEADERLDWAAVGANQERLKQEPAWMGRGQTDLMALLQGLGWL